jgi:hypothetical protein
MWLSLQRFLFCWMVLLACAGDVLAQSVSSDRCTVSAEPVVYESPGVIRQTANSTKVLGTFDTVVAEGAMISKVYRLPRTKLFVIASVRYEEHFLVEQKPGLIAMRLFVSGKKREDWLSGVAFAEAEVPFETFGAGTLEDSLVTTLIKVKGRSMLLVTMSCRKHSRR